MIITAADVEEFERSYRRFAETGDASGADFLRWLTNNPQVLMCAGYHEYVAGAASPHYASLIKDGELDAIERPTLRTQTGEWVIPSEVSPFRDEGWVGLRIARLLDAVRWRREAEEEASRDPTYPLRDDLLAIDEITQDAIVGMPSADECLQAAKLYVGNPLVDPTVWISPKVWTPGQQEAEKNQLAGNATALLSSLQYEEVHLVDLKWQELEEIVAEMLRAQGMEIHRVNENPQGGRDIIGRVLLPTGEVLTYAVEVKHKDVVDRPDVQTALGQNAHFPMLMMVTSGRFTAGVQLEASKPENRMRLHLRDGVAVRDMIRSYRLGRGK